MKHPIVVLWLAMPGALAFSQDRDPFVNRLERVAKTFPPDLVAPAKTATPAKASRPYCFYRAPGQKSLSVKPCPPPRRLRLLPPTPTGR